MPAEKLDYGVFNIGSGTSHSVREVAEKLARQLGRELAPEVTGRYRVGDIRHCFADISAARAQLGYAPSISFERGLSELTAWLRTAVATDLSHTAHNELISRCLSL